MDECQYVTTDEQDLLRRGILVPAKRWRLPRRLWRAVFGTSAVVETNVLGLIVMVVALALLVKVLLVMVR